jgi:tetratricopeptide (TPR) repeat protein
MLARLMAPHRSRSARALIGALFLAGCGSRDEAPRSQAATGGYVGSATCAPCHAREFEAWSGSDHDRAMAVADASTVLGDFSGARLEHHGVSTTFLRRGEAFVMRTDGPDGLEGEFEVAYTFGVDPLQQYLLALDGGRFQAHTAAWDTRPAEQGGQRWFSLLPDEPIAADDELHWTRRAMNWNASCAECHSTDVRRGYDPATNTYATTFAEIDVGCEACHGAGSPHVDWARAGADRARDPRAGLLVDLADRSGGAWTMDAQRGIAARTAARSPDPELDTCGRCHARRRPIAEGYAPDAALLDTHVPALLERELYEPDGRTRDEVFEWGSFRQSRMHAAGVRCTDCHEPHGLRLHAQGNALCNVCHLPERFDTPAHHHHPQGARGSACVDCHMPARVYMGVDARRDHGFHVPRPDLAGLSDAPDACSACHADRGAPWAAERVAEWFPDSARRARPTQGPTFAAAWEGDVRAARDLVRMAQDRERSAIARASALAELAAFPSAGALESLRAALTDADALVRLAALAALEPYPADVRLALAYPLLGDARLAVRSEAAHLLADVELEAAQRPAFDAALAEWIATQRLNLDTPQARHNLALLDERRGFPEQAEAGYRGALALEADFVPAAVNLADLLRAQAREEEAQAVLRAALEHAPRAAALHGALGLSLVRVGRTEDALEPLRRACELAPQEAHHAYVYAVALHSLGSPAGALRVLDLALQRHPRDVALLSAAATFRRDAGDATGALELARRLLELAPEDLDAQALVSELEAALR